MNNESLKQSSGETGSTQSGSSGWDSLKDVPFAGAIKTDELSTLSLEQTDKMGGKVDAFSVTASDQNGNTIKTSNIIAGEQANITLENGNMVSREDFEKALVDFIAENATDETKFMRISPSKEFSDSGEMIADMMAAAVEGKDILRLMPEPKISTQDARRVIIDNGDRQVKSSDLFLGKDRIELPNGEYIAESSVQTALGNYMMQVPKEPAMIGVGVAPEGTTVIPEGGTITPENTTAISEKQVVKTIKRDEKGKKILGKILPVILSAALSSAAFVTDGRTENTASATSATTPYATEMASPVEVPTIEDETFTFDAAAEAHEKFMAGSATTPYATEMASPVEVPTIEDETFTFDAAAEAHEKFMAGINIGETYDVPTGVAVRESSDYNHGGANATGEVGKNLRPGNYVIESFSILDPTTHQTNNVTWEQGTNINSYLEQVAEKYGTTVDKLEAKLHLGTMNGGAAGWVELNDLEQATIINNQGE